MLHLFLETFLHVSDETKGEETVGIGMRGISSFFSSKTRVNSVTGLVEIIKSVKEHFLYSLYLVPSFIFHISCWQDDSEVGQGTLRDL